MRDECSPIEAINKIKDVLCEEERLCKGVSARNAEGESTWAHSDDAVSWCIEGAYYMLGFDQNMAVRYLHDAAAELYSMGLVKVNDELGYEAISKVMDKALEEAIAVENAIEM